MDPENQQNQSAPDPHLAALVRDITGIVDTPNQPDPVEQRLEQAVEDQSQKQPQDQADQPVTTEDPKPDDKQKVDEKVESQKKEEQPQPEPEQPRIEVRKPQRDRIKEMIATALKEATARQKPEPAPAQNPEPEPQKKQESDIINTLSESDREELRLVRLGAAEDPKLKAMQQRLEAFHAADKAKRQSLLQADPERTFDENDQEYADWLNKKPKLAINDVIRLATKSTEAELSRKLDERMREQQRMVEEKVKASEAKPVLSQRAEGFGKLVVETIADNPPEEISELIETIKSGGDVAEADPLFGEIIQREMQEAQTLGTAFLSITTGAEKFNPGNKLHSTLAEFVRGQDEYFKQHGGDARVVNGRQFMTRQEFVAEYQKDPTVVDRAWTTSDDQILRAIAFRSKMNVEARVKAQAKALEKAGFKREKQQKPAEPAKPEVAKPEQKPPAKNPPQVRGGIAPGAANRAGGMDIPRGMSDSDIALLIPS